MTIDGVRALAWEILRQLRYYSQLNQHLGREAANDFDTPVVSYAFRALLWQIMDPELKPVGAEEDLLELEPRSQEHRKLLRSWRAQAQKES
jgi:hypothetical protein